MKHYNDDGTPTLGHMKLVQRAYGLSTRLHEGGYVRHVRVTHTGVDSGKFRIRLAEEFPNGLNWKAKRNRTYIGYAMDELSLEAVRDKVGYYGVLTIRNLDVDFGGKSLVVKGDWELHKKEG